MIKTMTSINPPFSGLILDGIKTIEWRTKPLPLGWHELYETKKKGGLGKVIGQFEVVENIKVDLFELACNDEKGLIQKGCVDWGFLNDYATLKRPCLYANVIGKVERYDKSKELNEFRHICPSSNIDTCYSCRYFIKTEKGVFCDNIVKRPPQSYMNIKV